MTKLNKKVELALLSFIVCAAMLLALCCIGGPVSAFAAESAASDFDGGSGTASDPYLISNETQLLAINNTTFTNCSNYGKVSAKCTAWGGIAAAGGIVGELYKNNVNNWSDYFISCYSSESSQSTSTYSSRFTQREYKGKYYATSSSDEYY